MLASPKVVFLGMLGQPGAYPPSIFSDRPGGDDEILWMRLLLREIGLLDRIDFQGIRVSHGEPLPAGDAADGFILGGSFHSVNDGLSWQQSLAEWLKMVRSSGKPLLGICGGHQMMCHVQGCPVETFPAAPLAGTYPVTLTEAGRRHPLFHGFGPVPRFQFGNSEHVPSPPTGATVLAGRIENPVCALDHGGGWYSVQFHPELGHEVFVDYWRQSEPDYVGNYQPAPEASGVVRNFLVGTEVVR